MTFEHVLIGHDAVIGRRIDLHWDNGAEVHESVCVGGGVG